MPAQRAECPVCSTRLPERAQFCPACGTKLDGGDTVRADVPAHETTAAPVRIERADARWFGIAPPTVLLALTVAAGIAAVALIVLDNLVAGLLVLGLALLLAAAFLESGRRKPDADVVRASVDAVDSVRARAGALARSWAETSAARREVSRRRAEVVRLQGERGTLLRGLGEEVYAGGDGAATRERIAALDERVAALEREAAAIATTARARAQEARLQAQPTEVVRRDGDD